MSDTAARVDHAGTSLTAAQTWALEAFADTIIPGCQRGPDDEAIAGVSSDPGAVEAGALAVLTDPATGIEDGVAGMADLLNEIAAEFAESHGSTATPGMEFASLSYVRRRDLVTHLTSPERLDHDLWFLLALFAYMAYDSAPHLNTAKALEQGHPGLQAMGFADPQPDGRWRFEPASYARPLARLRGGTDENGNLP